jgi:transposase-like protein
MTLRHEGQAIWNISRTLKGSSSAVTKTCHRKGRPRVTVPLLQRISSLELTAPQIAA